MVTVKRGGVSLGLRVVDWRLGFNVDEVASAGFGVVVEVGLGAVDSWVGWTLALGYAVASSVAGTATLVVVCLSLRLMTVGHVWTLSSLKANRSPEPRVDLLKMRRMSW